MSTTIESLELEIVSNSKSAVNGIDALTESLGKLKGVTTGKLGLSAVVKELESFNGVDVNGTKSKIVTLSAAISTLSNLPKVNLAGVINPLKNLPKALDGLTNTDMSSLNSGLGELVSALAPLSDLSKSNLSGYITSLGKIPKVLEGLNEIDMGAFATKIQEVATAMKPLADEMEKVSNGFSAMPTKIQKLLKSTEKIPSSNKKAAVSFTDLYHKMKVVGNVIISFGKKIWSAVEKSMDYTENMNLFSVSMGEYAGEAMDYANTVSDAMGIDTSEWIRAQGIFMTMATGFGVASDRAAIMSKNLTQLGYDLSSFYNMDVEDAMLKLKSGLAGELEPLRAIGYDLSQAKLEATALELGIDKSVSAMTQAEKAQLRYYAIMTQVTVAQGDMARTLDDPANQVRVLKAEFNMAAREIGNIFIPILNAIIPYAIAVTKVIRGLAEEIALLFGYEMPEVDYSGVNAMGNSAENTSSALEDATESAKKLKSYMLGFDELNVINPNEGNTSSEDASGTAFDFELPEYDFMGGLVESKVNGIVTMIEESLAEIMSIFSGFSLAIGAVLAFSGVNVPLGIALMALGAVGLVTNTALNWSSMENPLETILGTLTGMVGGALLATGAILAFTGINIPLGIALMAGGAISLATAFALNWESLSEPVRQVIGTLEGVVGGALLTLGAILAFTGVNIPMGIALMATGAISLASAVALNWDALTGDVGSSIFTIETLLGGALLGVGAVLAFTGANIALGIGLMAVGALTLGAAITMNTTKLSDEVKGVIAYITSAVSLALLAVGAILAFTGANIPLGIALMAGGALTMGTAIIPNWEELSDSVKSAITELMTTLGISLLAIGGILAFSGANIPLGIGFMLVGAASLGTAVALNWKAISDALRGPVGVVTAIVSGALLALGAILAFTGVGIPIGIALMLVGAAGLATVTALNWDTIKDKVSSVIKGIGKILSGAMLVLGVLMCLSGVGIGLGLALIFGSLKLSEKAWGTDDNPIIQFVKKMMNGIVNIVNKAIEGINDLFHISFDGLVIAGIEIIPAFDKKLINIPKIPLMAEGGFPEQGQMFIAREAGAEMVGNIGRRTAVANNDQIVSSISGGVAEANEEQNALLREQNSLLRAILEKDSGVYLDGKNLTDSVEKYQRERGRVLITGGVI